MSASVIAVIATFQRPNELARLLDSLAQIPSSFDGIVVVDNAALPSAPTRNSAGNPVIRLAPGCNLGCGGGLRLAEQTALEEFPSATHLWVLDDDAVVESSTLDRLLDAMDHEAADAAHPMVIDKDGFLGWFPGLLDSAKFRVIRERQTPEQFVARCGDAPIPFSWSQGIALLVTRRIIEQVGFHRDDYWVRGEDLEFTLRMTARARGIYVPAARARHLPPITNAGGPDTNEYAKHRAMLQNLAYTAIRLPHGRRLLRTLPGNWLRFVRTWPLSVSMLRDLFETLLWGALYGRPAGHQIRTRPKG